MPKKSRKMKQRAASRRVGEMLPQAEETAGAVETAVAPARPMLSTYSRVSTPATYDYSHIYSDLKRIALFATFFFAVLIALSFIIK